jgi:Tfp pilus assembly protein PilN
MCKAVNCRDAEDAEGRRVEEDTSALKFALDIIRLVTIMAVFYAPSLYDARSFSERRYHSQILRTHKSRTAKRTPDTPQIQEIT